MFNETDGQVAYYLQTLDLLAHQSPLERLLRFSDPLLRPTPRSFPPRNPPPLPPLPLSLDPVPE